MQHPMSEDNYLLSIVIPISKMAGKLENLRISLSSIEKHPEIQAVLIHDKQDPVTGSEVIALVNSLNNSNIQIFEGVFGNPGSARNRGIELSKSDWITFWDSDDIGNALEVVSDIERYGLTKSLIVGQFKIVNHQLDSESEVSQSSSISEIPKSPGIWRFVFRNEELTKFKEISMGEDQLFIVYNLPENQFIHFSTSNYYTYFIGHATQLTRNKSKIRDLLIASSTMLELIGSSVGTKRTFLAEITIRQLLTILKKGSTSDRIGGLKTAKNLWTALGLLEILRTLHKVIRTQKQQLRKKDYVSLTGGLGNQLFQVAAALDTSRGNKVRLVYELGSPRVSEDGNPDLFQFDISQIGERHNLRAVSWFEKKIAGFTLRMGVSPRLIERNRLAERTVIQVSEFFLSRLIGEKIKIALGNGVGFCNVIKTNQARLFLGYFQSYRWGEGHPDSFPLKALELINEGSNYLHYKEISFSKKILAVHIRLGDYKQESDFGILSPNYYNTAVQKILARNQFDSIWAFSDEPDIAKSSYLRNSELPVTWIETQGMSSAETLQTLRLCHGYVIGNSSFSWWGAKLSFQENPPVLAPSKWFAGQTDPLELIPEDWERLQPEYVTSNFFD